MKKIALLTWWTQEIEISLKSAKNVEAHLTKKHKVDTFCLPEDICKFVSQQDKYDLIIPMGHGEYIEDGKIFGLLEMMNKPFLLSWSEWHCISMNKYLTNMIAQDLWFTVPQTFLVQEISDIKKGKIKGKLFVKPNHWGSSLDAGIFDTIEKATKLIQKILKYDDVIIQKAIKWREFTVSVVGDYNKKITPIAITEIVTSRAFFDFDAKYKRAETQEITPAKIDKKMQITLEKMSIAIHKRLKLKTLSRIDFFYSKGIFYFIEVNTIPGMTDKSFLPQALAYHGYKSLGAFLEEQIKNM